MSRDWRLVGAKEPYFGVLSTPEFRAAAVTPAVVEKFYRTGVTDIERVRDWCLADIGAAPEGGRALDIGAGVGRLSFAMARVASEVVGFDASETMLDLARARAAKLGVTNAAFVEKIPDGPFDWINSYIVFQHIPPAEGLELLSAALERAAPGALLTLHVTLWADETVRAPRNVIARAATRLARARARTGDAPVETLIQMHYYNFSEVMRRLVEAGFPRAVLRHVEHSGSHGVWVLARKATTA